LIASATLSRSAHIMSAPTRFSGFKRVAAASLCFSLLTATAADWTQWRGPDREDRSPDTGLLKQWPAGGPRRAWLNRDVGLGYAGYSIVDGRLYTMGLRDVHEFLIAIDTRDGKELWSTAAGVRLSNKWGDGPRGTPTVDGDRVYALSGKGTLICARRDNGEVIWKKSMVDDLGGSEPGWGYTESVLVVGDRVFCTPGGSDGTMAALNKNTGEVLWRSKALTDNAHYSSPIHVEHAGTPQVIQLVEKRFFGLRPDTGEVLWEGAWPGGRVAVIPTPIYHDGHVYVTSGYNAGCALVKIGPNHEVTPVYKNNVMVNHHGGVVRVGDHLYGHSDRRGWVCQEFLTGKEVWLSDKLEKGALTYADGMLYCLGEDSGNVVLVEASPSGWNERGRFKLEPQTTRRSRDGRIWTHPVVIDGKLYLRDQEVLFCYDVKGG
jgi:outer membrane protein assembly factor BamB